MIGLPFSVAVFGREHHSVISLAELDSLGITKRQRQLLLEAGLLDHVLRGVYRLASGPDTLEARCRAICLAVPEAVITGRAAGRLWGLRRMGLVRAIDVRVPHFSHSLRHPMVVERRCNNLPEMDVVHRPDGIRVVSPARLCFDLAAVLDAVDLESVVEQVLDREYCGLPFLIETGLRLHHPRRPGSRQFQALMRSQPQWGAAADSHQEVMLRDALVAAGVRGIQIQHPVVLDERLTVHLDMAVPSIRWGIEIDHYHFHGGRAELQCDKRRDRLLVARGWRVTRVTDDDFGDRLTTTVDELLDVYVRLLHPIPTAS